MLWLLEINSGCFEITGAVGIKIENVIHTSSTVCGEHFSHVQIYHQGRLFFP